MTPDDDGCLSEETMAGLADGRLPSRARELALAHLHRCEACTAWLAQLLRVDGGASGDPELSSAPNRRIGRYVLIEEVGRGGMGTVHAAYDPKLDRKIAIKLLREDGTGTVARMLREAKVLARVSHRNVVVVHDADTHAGQAYIAMELVPGKTLRRWLAERRRSWREILRVLVDAARGLAAAHEAGVVHRDFKPDNMLVTQSGRVVVTDFGLARDVGEDGSQEASTEQIAIVDDDTAAGVVIGTPAYMAPEQFTGTAVDARADQFAWCVVAFEALAGRRPFAGYSALEVRASMVAGRMASPRDGAMPRWVMRALTRGLAFDPADRHASLAALIEHLETRPRRRRIAFTVAVVAVSLLATVGVRTWLDARRTAACEHTGRDEAHAHWNDDARGSVTAAILGTGVIDAERTAAKTVALLDEYSARWRGAREAVCVDAEVRRTIDPTVAERAHACLQERATALTALVEVLTAADEPAVWRSIPAAAGLPHVDACRDPSRRTSPTSRDPEAAAVRVALSRAWALEAVGDYERGLAVAHDAVERARALEEPSLRASARISLGALLAATGAYAEAEAVLEEAYFESLDVDDWENASRAATRLTGVVGSLLERDAEGLRWARHARHALDARHLAPDHLEVGLQLHELAGAHGAAQDLDRAIEVQHRAVAILRDALGSTHPQVATAILNLGVFHGQAGDYRESLRLIAQALAIDRSVLGSRHPMLADTLQKLGAAHYAIGDHAKALELHERALQLQEAALGSTHPDVAATLSNLAAVVAATGDHVRSRDLLERALLIEESEDDPAAARTLLALGTELHATGEIDRAQAMFERVLAIQGETLGEDHPEVARTLDGLAQIRSERGDAAEAEALHRRALAIRERVLGPDRFEVAVSLFYLAHERRRAGATSEACALLERALGIYAAHEGIQEGEIEALLDYANARVSIGMSTAGGA
jgi:tetratricopeptide (TPR) repeat protein/predicted Ser/Thr protein kinase